MKLKHIVIGTLVVATGVGFWYAAKQTNGGKGSDTGGGSSTSVQYAEVTATGATLYDAGQPLVTLSAADKTAAIELVHARMKAQGVSVYFIFTQSAEGGWYATGYKDGVSASDDLGPFADQALAMQAGTKWVQAQAVPIPGAAVGARSMARSANGGGLTGGRPKRGFKGWREIRIDGKTAYIDTGRAKRDRQGRLGFTIEDNRSGTNCIVSHGQGQLWLCCDTPDGYTCIPLPIAVPGDGPASPAEGCYYTTGGADNQLYICCPGSPCIPIPIVFGPLPSD